MQRHPVTARVVWGLVCVVLAADAFVGAKGVLYAHETTRLRNGMSVNERAILDAALHSDSNSVQVMIELARRQARVDHTLHLSVSLDTGMLSLEQDGATLRAVPAEIGADSWAHAGARDSVRITAPRGERRI
jgi:hypothetical protein